MIRSGFARSVAVSSVAALAALACGGSSGTTSGTDTSKGEIIIASDLPTSGADASSGLPAQNGAQFAVQQAGAIKGFKLTFLPFDDAVNGVHDPQKGAQNVNQMLSNSKVLGMVGPFNSNVARAEIPVANNASLAMISPSNTNECLTQTFDYCNPKPAALRPTQKNNYFRVAAADTFQGPGMADYAYDVLQVKKAATWSDNETFGKGVADNFDKEFKKKGGTIVARQDFDVKTTNDFRNFLNQAKAGGAQGIYAGATSATKGCIPRAQMKGLFNPDIFYMGPDGISDSQCIKDAGDQATDKMYSTNGAADATQNPEAKATIDAYKKQFPKKEDTAAYTFPAYDCAKILIDAIGRAIDANGGKAPSRQQVVDAMAATKNLKLLTGTYTFDKNGDPTAPTLAYYQLKGTPLDWTFVKQTAVGA
jgi:branched-chain amino acid transport system substrate-binding protein